MRDQGEFEASCVLMDGTNPSVMCGAECQRHPIASLAHAAKKLTVLDRRVADLRTKTGMELRGQLTTEMEGLAVVAVHDLARLMWDLRGGYKETLAD